MKILYGVQTSEADFLEYNWLGLSVVDKILKIKTAKDGLYLLAPNSDRLDKRQRRVSCDETETGQRKKGGGLQGFSSAKGVKLFFGDSLNVNKRFMDLVQDLDPKYVVRVTLSQFFIDEDILFQQLELIEKKKLDLVSMPVDYDLRFGADVCSSDFFSKFDSLRGASFRPWADARRDSHNFKFESLSKNKMPTYNISKSERLISNIAKIWPERWETGNSEQEFYNFMLFDFKTRNKLPTAHVNILDLACGYGAGSKLISNFGYKATGVDYNEATIDQAIRRFLPAENLSFEVGDALEYRGKKPFNAVFSVCTMGHLEQDELFLLNVRKNLTFGGLFYNAPALFLENPTGKILSKLHKHEYSLDELIKKMEKYFKVLEVFGEDRGYFGSRDVATRFAIVVAMAN